MERKRGPGSSVGRRGDNGLSAGGEEGGGEDGAAVEWEADDGLVGGIDDGRLDVGDRELAWVDGAGEEEVLCGWVEGEGCCAMCRG